MKAFRLDGSYDIQVMCQVMFCAGPNGCPPSNCLDSGTNELFVSHGRRKRSVQTNQTEETLSAIIRVLAKGEEDEEDSEEQLAGSPLLHSFDLAGHNDLVCMSEVWFISSIVSVSLVCLLLSAMIVIWGCSSLKNSNKLPL
ncbi:hypothetical protein AB6A40_004752 [Gnathostoma spinigerum]|uniref:ZP domain-containing protein n=1 Tax=Gnathostoma spinigerum TaxID=75299 RepID=A0ABD6EM54_9BILA